MAELTLNVSDDVFAALSARKGAGHSEADYAAELLTGLLGGLTTDEQIILAEIKRRAGNPGVWVVSNQLQMSIATKVSSDRYIGAVNSLSSKGLIDGKQGPMGWEFQLTEIGFERA